MNIGNANKVIVSARNNTLESTIMNPKSDPNKLTMNAESQIIVMRSTKWFQYLIDSYLKEVPSRIGIPDSLAEPKSMNNYHLQWKYCIVKFLEYNSQTVLIIWSYLDLGKILLKTASYSFNNILLRDFHLYSAV